MRLAAMLACLGACNALASPKRLLRYVPATLYEVGTAVVVALTFAPQLVEDARPGARGPPAARATPAPGWREIGRLAVPVLVGAARALARNSPRRWSRGATVGRCGDAPRDPAGIAPGS